MADDGCLHVVAERSSIRDALARLDLSRARLLTRLSLFWVRRVRCVPSPQLGPYLRGPPCTLVSQDCQVLINACARVYVEPTKTSIVHWCPDATTGW